MDPDEWIGFSVFLLVVVGYPMSLLVGNFTGAFDVPTFNGCVTGCSMTTISFLPPTNPFYVLFVKGDFFGFVASWFSSLQTRLSFLTIAVGTFLMLMGLNLNFGASFLASGIQIGVGSQGAKLAQSFGIGLVVWGFMTSIFAAWFDLLGLGLGAALYSFIALCYFYGVWGWARSLR